MPVWGIDDQDQCMCHAGATCPSAGKHPIPGNGVHSATTDLSELEAWWQANPRANIGIATSAEFSILDIDAKSGGLDTFATLEDQYGEAAFQSPYRVRTGGGGLHIAFRSPPGTRSRNPLLPGINYKAEGGMIVAPYSRHRSGNLYCEGAVEDRGDQDHRRKGRLLPIRWQTRTVTPVSRHPRKAVANMAPMARAPCWGRSQVLRKNPKLTAIRE